MTTVYIIVKYLTFVGAYMKGFFEQLSCRVYEVLIEDGRYLTATELCERCEEDKATVSRSIEYLENSGYLTCESKTAKRYKSPLKLTDKGIEVAKKIVDKIAYFLEQISVKLTEDERLQFYHSLSLISNGLNKIANNR